MGYGYGSLDMCVVCFHINVAVFVVTAELKCKEVEDDNGKDGWMLSRAESNMNLVEIIPTVQDEGVGNYILKC